MGLTTVPQHHATHENGGSDEIDATGLTGAGGGGGGGSSAVAQTSVTRSNSTLTIPSGTLTAISFNQENRDDDGNWASSPNPTRVTISQDDTYDIVGQVQWFTSNVSGTFRKAGIYKNGVLLHEYSSAAAGSGFANQVVVDYSVALVNGDYIELKATQDSGSSLAVGAISTFLVVSRGGGGDFLPVDTLKAFKGDSPFGFREKYADGRNETAYVSLPGNGQINMAVEDSTGGSASLDLAGTEIFLTSDDDIFIEPFNGPVVVDTGTGIVFPAISANPTQYDQGQLYYNDVIHRMRVLRKADGFNGIWQDFVAQGNAPFAFPCGWVPNGTYTTAITLPANGGAIAVPFEVRAPMILATLEVYNTDTTGDREFEMNLYLDAWNATAVQAQGGSGGDAYNFAGWTSSGAAIQGTSYPTGDPIWLEPGIVWVVLRNTHATNTLGIGSLASAGTFSAYYWSQTKTVGSFLDTTLDLLTGWTKSTSIPGIVLRGRVFHQDPIW